MLQTRFLCFMFIMVLVILSGTQSFAEGGFDPDTTEELIFDAPTPDDTTDDASEDSFEYDQPQPPQETGGLNAFINSLKWTYRHDVSFATEKDPGIVTNESSLRMEWEKLFSDTLFFRFDGNGSVLPGSDHRAEAKDENDMLDGNIRELNIQAGFDRISFKLGQQILVWGESDLSVITDVVSPRDLSDLIFIDLEDSRLGQLMLTTDLYTKKGNFSVFINPNPEFDKLPAAGTRYDTNTFPSESVVVHDKPDHSDVEYGFRWKRTFGKLDFALMAADLIRNTKLIERSKTLQDGTIELYEGYEPYSMGGVAMSYALDSFLLKTEMAYKHEFPMQATKADRSFQTNGYQVLDVAGGFDYDANGKYQITCEVSNRSILDHDRNNAESESNRTALYLNLLKKYLNDNLELQYSLYYQFQHTSIIHDMQALYKYSDNAHFEIRFTVFSVQDNKSDMWNNRDEDRISLGYTYYF